MYRNERWACALCAGSSMLLAACSAVEVHRVRNQNGDISVHAIATNPQNSFGFVTRDVLHYGKASGSTTVADEFAAVASGESTTQVVTKQLSETFDQPTTQSLAQFHAAYLGLIANLTDPENQRAYWEEIAAIRCEATDVRKEVLARTEYYLALRAISAVERLREERDYLVRRIDTLQRDSAVMSDLLGRDIQRVAQAQAARTNRSSAASAATTVTAFLATALQDDADESSDASVGEDRSGKRSAQPYVASQEAPTVEKAFESTSPAPTVYRAEEVAESSMAYQWRLAQLSPEYRGPWLYRDPAWRRAQFRVVSSDLLAKQRVLGEVIERLCLAQQREDRLTVHIISLLGHRTAAVSSSPATDGASRVPMASHENCDRCRMIRNGSWPGAPVEPAQKEAAQPAANVVTAK